MSNEMDQKTEVELVGEPKPKSSFLEKFLVFFCILTVVALIGTIVTILALVSNPIIAVSIFAFTLGVLFILGHFVGTCLAGLTVAEMQANVSVAQAQIMASAEGPARRIGFQVEETPEPNVDEPESPIEGKNRFFSKLLTKLLNRL